MQKLFGKQYQTYMKNVGPFFPCPVPGWGNFIDVSDHNPEHDDEAGLLHEDEEYS